MIGEGAFGKVYKAYKKDTKEVVAIKQLIKEFLNGNPKLQELYNSEVSLLKILSSENIIKYIDNFNTNDCCYLVLEYCNQGDLGSLLVKHKRFPEQRVISYFKQLLNGFKDLHKHQVVHRDLKPENILINQKTLKIADLGFAKQIQGTTQTCLGTYTTMAPEVLEQKPYGLEVDVFSLGVMLYKLLYGVYPYRSDTGNLRQVIKERIKNIKYNVPEVIISDVMKDLLQKMICYDRRERITWEQIHQHPILQMDTFGVSLLLPAGSVLQMPDNNQEAISLYKKFKHLMVTDSDYECKEVMQPGFNVNSEFNVAADKESSNEASHRSEYEALKQMDTDLKKKESVLDCILDASLKYNHYRQQYVLIFQILKHICKIPKESRNKIVQFAFTKKAYNMTIKMENSLSRGQNFFNIKYFEEFKKDENYKNIVNQMMGNVDDFYLLFQSSKNDVQQILLGLQQEQQRKTVLIDLLQKELVTDQLTDNYQCLMKLALSYDYRKLNNLESNDKFDQQTKRSMFQYYIFTRDMISKENQFQQTEFNFAGYINSIQQYNLEDSIHKFKEIVDELGLANIKL
ncbi:hypothetical protein ABPG72_013383 [Tetrahymena utriculariae]